MNEGLVILIAHIDSLKDSIVRVKMNQTFYDSVVDTLLEQVSGLNEEAMKGNDATIMGFPIEIDDSIETYELEFKTLT